MDRQTSIDFLNEMLERFRKDNISQFMRARDIAKCEQLADLYIEDPRFEELAEYANYECGLNVEPDEVNLSNNIFSSLMLFYCFYDEYDEFGDFDEDYLFSHENLLNFVRAMAESNEDIGHELAAQLGLDQRIVAPENFKYEDIEYYIIGLNLEVILLNYPIDGDDDDSEDESET